MGGVPAVVSNRPDGSDVLDHLVRLGLVVYGIVHLVIAGAALQLAFGDGGGSNASQQGAFTELASTPLGEGALWLIVIGMAALVMWQGTEAAVGHRSREGAKRAFKRVSSAGKAIVYAVLGYTAARKAIESPGSQGSGGSSSDSITADVMAAPGGQLLVGAVGVGVVAIGAYLGYRGLSDRFTRDLDDQATSGDRRGPIILLGKVGYLAKGSALAAVGALFVAAALQEQAKESGGLDVALHELLRQPLGGVLVSAIALGLAAFGLYCFAWARHLDR